MTEIPFHEIFGSHRNKMKTIVRTGSRVVEEEFVVNKEAIIESAISDTEYETKDLGLKVSLYGHPEDIDFSCGYVGLDIDLQEFKDGHRAIIEDLFVPNRLREQGIGSGLITEALNVIRQLKDYFNISDPVTVSGVLPNIDKGNGNWRISVPLCKKIADRFGCNCYFTREDKEKPLSATAFLLNIFTRKDGYVHFVV